MRKWISLFALAAGLFLLQEFQLVNFHETDTIDWRFRLRGFRKAHPSMVLVTIDDASLASVGEWPWPRGIYAGFLQIVSRHPPRFVFFDILFSESSPDSLQDEKFQAAIEQSGNVLLSFFYDPATRKAFYPLTSLRESARGSGYVNALLDPDGRVRRFQPFVRTPEGHLEHASLLIIPEDMKASLLARKEEPLWIHYPGLIESFRHISFADVIRLAGLNQEEKLRELFQDKIVLVGHTATATTDIQATPFSAGDVGLLIHASALHTLLANERLRPIPAWIYLLLLWGEVIFAVGFLSRFSPWKGLLLLLAAGAGYVTFTFLVFIFARSLWPVMVPLAVLGLSYFVVVYTRYFEALLERRKSEQELQLAADVQRRFLPSEVPDIKGLEVAFESRSARQVGGDFYDWKVLNRSAAHFCVGDVSGKGMPAALYMAKALNDLRSLAPLPPEPDKICARLNEQLLKEDSGGMFLTFMELIVDISSRILRYTSAGHEPLIHYSRRAGKSQILKGANGMPLGLFPEAAYHCREISLEEGDVCLAFSDGVKELRNSKKESWGLERLLQTFENLCKEGKNAPAILASLFERMKDFQKDIPAHDDCTLLCLKKV